MCLVINLSALIDGKLIFQKNPLQDLLSSLNPVISTNESTRYITGHMVYNLAYMYLNLTDDNHLGLTVASSSDPNCGYGC